MYNPKDIFSQQGLYNYEAHITNISNGLDYITNHLDDLHLGALNTKQLDNFYELTHLFEKLEPLLRKGDGETHD